MEHFKMNRQIYSCPDYNHKSDAIGKPNNLSIHENESNWIDKMVLVPPSKRKPIILKRGRSSWPVTSNGKNQKNIRETCRGSAGAAESLKDQKFTSHGEFVSRRNSFLYRSDSLNSKYFTRGISAKSSVCYMDQKSNKSQDIVVTPFAQILLTLRMVKTKLTRMFQLKGKSTDTKLEEIDDDDINFSEESMPSVSDTLSNLEWCLYQLENVQTHRSVSELATSKFKRLLSKELIQKNSKNGNKNICDYICQTFMDEVPYISEEHLDDVLFNQYNWKSGENFNIESPKEENQIRNICQISELILSEWGPDIFQMSTRYQGCILRNLTISILESRRLFSNLKLDMSTMINFLEAVENNYRLTNSYHNSIHAADVVQSVHVIISMIAFKNVFSDLEIFSALLSAVIHDIDHPGVTNQFLINTNDSLAILYNDISVLENHHLAVGFTIMKNDECNILTSFSKSQQQVIRRMVIDMVLATDMSKHMTMLADLKTMVETKKVSGSGILNLDNYNDRIQILQNLIHCADLSNPTKPISLYVQWTERVMEEFFSQGDKERERGIENSPMCDRLTASVAKSQVSFIDFIVYPLWETWAELVQPEANVMLNNLFENRKYYEEISIENESNISK